MRKLASPRHLQRTHSARETGVMQGLEKHNLTKITDASAAFLIQLQRNFVRAFLVSALLILIDCLQNSEIPAVYGHLSCRQSKKEHLLFNQQ